ncbi:methyltransferase domain-containing protein [soil metagenome]
MVGARQRVQDAGLLDALTGALVDAVPEGVGLVVDAGGGTGHHLAAVLGARPEASGVVLDTAKPTLRRAARAHPRLLAAAADSSGRWPLQDGAADAVLVVFAPRNAGEMARVLRPGGLAVVATPQPEHLAELVAPMGMLAVDPDKPDRLAAAMGEGFALAGEASVAAAARISRAQAVDVALMGPAGFHTDTATLEQRAASLPPQLTVTVAVRVSRWALRG